MHLSHIPKYKWRKTGDWGERAQDRQPDMNEATRAHDAPLVGSHGQCVSNKEIDFFNHLLLIPIHEGNLLRHLERRLLFLRIQKLCQHQLPATIATRMRMQS